jgi:hypothetical protein
MADPGLERELRELRVAWPETPDLAGAVGARLAGAAPPRAPRRFEWPGWRIAIAVAAALIAVVMAVPPARSAILEWLGFASAPIERAEPEPSRFGGALQLGRAVTLAEARELADFPLVVPADLGPPDAVYFSSAPVRRVDFVYRPRPGLPRASATGAGLLVSEFRAIASPVIEKTAGQQTTIERLTVGGDPAFFLSGAEHGFAYVSRARTEFEEGRLAGNTLLVERRDGVLLRLEGELSREEAARIAASAR